MLQLSVLDLLENSYRLFFFFFFFFFWRVCVVVRSSRHSKRGPESNFYIQSEDILTKRGQNFTTQPNISSQTLLFSLILANGLITSTLVHCFLWERIGNKLTCLANFNGYPGLSTWLSDLLCDDAFKIFPCLYLYCVCRICRIKNK